MTLRASAAIPRLALSGAWLALACIVAIGAISRTAPPGVSFQPSATGAPAEAFLRAANEETVRSLLFSAADTLLVPGYLLVFIGLHAATRSRSRRMAGSGLFAGILMGLCDLVENGFYISYASGAALGHPLVSPHLPLLYGITALKEAFAWTAYLAFGLALPREDRLDRIVAVVLLLVPAVGLAGLAWDGIARARGWTIAFTLPFLIVWLHRVTRRAGS